jgi:hypothetical protein
MCLRADVDSTPEERACGDYDASRAKASSLKGLDTEHTTLIRIEDETRNGSLHSLQASVLFEKRSDRTSVEAAVTLPAWSPDSWPLAAVKHAELHHGEVGSPSHDSSERIDLADHGALCNAANRRIARHLPDRLERARNQPNTRSETRSSDRCFSAGMAGTDDYDVEFGFKGLQWSHTFKDKHRLRMAA